MEKEILLELKKEKQLNIFKQFVKGFTNLLPFNYNKKNNFLEKEVLKLLNIKDIKSINELILNGYRLSEKERKSYDKIVCSKILNDENPIKVLEELIIKNVDISSEVLSYILIIFSEKNIINNISDVNFENYSYKKYFEGKNLVNYLEKKFNDESFNKMFLNKIINLYNKRSYNSLLQLKSPFYNENTSIVSTSFLKHKETDSKLLILVFSFYLSEFMKFNNREAFMELFVSCKETSDQCVKNLSNSLSSLKTLLLAERDYSFSQIKKSDVENMIKNNINYYRDSSLSLVEKLFKYASPKIENYYEEERKEHLEKLVSELSITDNAINKLNNKINKKIINLKEDLSEELKIAIKKIESNIHFCLKNQKNLNHEQIFLLQKLLNEDIPEDLSKYLSIDISYRETLFNSEGKNATEILNNSLSKISTIIKDYVELINQNKVDELSVSNRKITVYTNKP